MRFLCFSILLLVQLTTVAFAINHQYNGNPRLLYIKPSSSGDHFQPFSNNQRYYSATHQLAEAKNDEDIIHQEPSSDVESHNSFWRTLNYLLDTLSLNNNNNNNNNNPISISIFGPRTVTRFTTRTSVVTSVTRCLPLVYFKDSLAASSACRRKRFQDAVVIDEITGDRQDILPTYVERVVPTVIPLSNFGHKKTSVKYDQELILSSKETPAEDDAIAERDKRNFFQPLKTRTVVLFTFTTTTVTRSYTLPATATSSLACRPPNIVLCSAAPVTTPATTVSPVTTDSTPIATDSTTVSTATTTTTAPATDATTVSTTTAAPATDATTVSTTTAAPATDATTVSTTTAAPATDATTVSTTTAAPATDATTISTTTAAPATDATTVSTTTAAPATESTIVVTDPTADPTTTPTTLAPGP